MYGNSGSDAAALVRMSTYNLLSLRTIGASLKVAVYSLRLRRVTVRLCFRPRCSSRAFSRWPWRTASVVPMMAGQAATAVKMPNTMFNSYGMWRKERA